jgi:hypothetical protein
MKKKTKVGNLQVDEDVGGRMTPKWYLEVPRAQQRVIVIETIS